MIIRKHYVKELNPSEYNPRKISDKQMSDLKKSITKFGIVDPIIININKDRQNIVVGVHQRLKACQEMGHEEIDCVEIDLPLEKEKELNIRLNKNNGEFNFHELINNFTRQEAVEYGFDLKDIEKGLNREAMHISKFKIKDHNYREEKKQEYLDKWKVKEGDLWQVGDHKLICGDSLKKETYDKLLGNEKVQLIFTDPPYGVEYHDTVGGFKSIENDDLKNDGLYNFLDKFIKLSVERLDDSGSFYMWHAIRRRRIFEDAIKNNGLEEINYIIWVKDCVSIKSAYHYKFQHEPCFFCKKNGAVVNWYGVSEESLVWELGNQDEGNIKAINLGNGIRIKQEGKEPLNIVRNVIKKVREVEFKKGDKLIIEDDITNDVWYIRRDPALQYLHPTQKPVELAIRAINNSTRILELVLDPFAGSGFTLLASERINRKARCIEMDPGYCATILERFNQSIGITPIKL